MADYKIITDSSADLSQEMIDELGVGVLQLDVVEEGGATASNDEVDVKEFYHKLRTKISIKTSAANGAKAMELVEDAFKAGYDVLYLGFSSGLSSTYETVASAGYEVAENYPDRKFVAVDTLAASLGQGLLVYKACMRRIAGVSLEENAKIVEDTKLKLAHWFTVDDLFFLKRGGRVSGVTAAVGTVLNIKPVLHVDDEGHLINISKSRGRKQAIKELLNKMDETGIDISNQDIFISHGDCMEDAEYLADMIREKYNPKSIVINYVGPVIGAHSGPNTLALFYEGEHR